MQSEKPEQTALGVARTRFIEGLAEKAREIEELLEPEAVDGSGEVSTELRGRLNALLASAQVFRLPQLADALKDGIERLDASGTGTFTDDDRAALRAMARALPELRESSERFSTVPSLEAIPAPVRRKSSPTLLGLPRTPPPEPPRPTPRPAAPTSSIPPARVPPSAPPMSVSVPTTHGTVLVMASPESKARIRAALPAGRYQVDDVPLRALPSLVETIRQRSPDLVFLDGTLALENQADVVRRLREDTLTSFIPIVLLTSAAERLDPLLAREAGADEVLVEPAAPGRILSTVERLLDAPSSELPFALPADPTPEELADRLSAEIRRGLADAVERGGDVRIPLGDGADLMAIAWSAIARVRAHVAERSRGRVRFRDPPRRGLPSLLGLLDEEEAPAISATEVPLFGRRILVADDDPAVLWFFSSLLREEGAKVQEVGDGAEALEAARRERPDVVISDILMPGLDGFALCRELQRDPSLAEVPTILLSWKEDFLERMKELEAGASGYLQKEAESSAILSRVREVLRPRARLEAQLAAGGDVRGRVEDVGIQTLLRAVGRLRPNASVVVRDAWNHFEAELRDGNLVALTRTAADGTFDRGVESLPILLGVSGGRFVVGDAEGTVRATLSGTLDEVLAEGAQTLGAVLHAVSGPGLAQAASVRFLPDVIEGVARQSPEAVRTLVERLARGESPRDLLFTGAAGPQMLDAILTDLARRGAVAEVRGPEGEDRIAIAHDAIRASAPPVEEVAPPEDSFHGKTTPSLPAEAPLERRSSLPAVLEELADVIPDHVSLRPEPEPSDLAVDRVASLSPVAEPSLFDDPAPPEPAPIAPPSPAPVVTEVKEGRGRIAWAVAATVATISGALFGAYRATTPRSSEAEPVVVVDEPAVASAPRLSDEPPTSFADELSFGRTVPEIVDPNVPVGKGEALLVIDPGATAGSGVVVRLGDRVLGPPPVKIAIPEGRHELAFQRGAETSFRYVYVRAGSTRLIETP